MRARAPKLGTVTYIVLGGEHYFARVIGTVTTSNLITELIQIEVEGQKVEIKREIQDEKEAANEGWI